MLKSPEGKEGGTIFSWPYAASGDEVEGKSGGENLLLKWKSESRKLMRVNKDHGN